MTRLTQNRTFFGVALVLALVGTVGLLGDDVPCYDGITDIPCPSMTGSNDSCETQFANQPEDKKKWEPGAEPPNRSAETTCNALTYNARKSGQWGEGQTKPCTSPGLETGYKCAPATDENGIVIRIECGRRYKCKWEGTSGGCVKTNDLATPGIYNADQYTLKNAGCKVLKGSD